MTRLALSAYSGHVYEILQRARTRLLQGWCRRALARTAIGAPCHPNNPHASAWSLHGAVMRAAYELGFDDATYATAREAVRWGVWSRHQLYLMWCDDNPAFTASKAVAVIDSILEG